MMLQPNSFYTYIEEVQISGTFDHFKVHYIIELVGYKKKQVKPMEVIKKDPSDPIRLKGLTKDNYELIDFDDKLPNYCEIYLNTDDDPGNKNLVDGYILMKNKKGGGNFNTRIRWDQISVTLVHNHPNLTHDGSSTSHMGDAD